MIDHSQNNLGRTVYYNGMNFNAIFDIIENIIGEEFVKKESNYDNAITLNLPGARPNIILAFKIDTWITVNNYLKRTWQPGIEIISQMKGFAPLVQFLHSKETCEVPVLKPLWYFKMNANTNRIAFLLDLMCSPVGKYIKGYGFKENTFYVLFELAYKNNFFVQKGSRLSLIYENDAVENINIFKSEGEHEYKIVEENSGTLIVTLVPQELHNKFKAAMNHIRKDIELLGCVCGECKEFGERRMCYLIQSTNSIKDIPDFDKILKYYIETFWNK